MKTADPDEPLVPFPYANGSGAGQANTMERWLRPFGVCEADLGLDLRSAARPLAVTRVLERCLRSDDPALADDDFLWDLPVGKRIQAILTLAVAWDGGRIELALRCPEPSCGQELEMDVTLEELAEIEEEVDARERVEVRIDGGIHALRRPTGRDQLAWMSGHFADEREALLWMVRTLAGLEGATDAGSGLEPDAVAALEEAMNEFDPLVNFVATVRCAACGREHMHEIDLEEIAFRRLRGVQLRLLRTVHRLARHYHWSEQEIFSVPQWRREYYLGLIEREER